MIPAIDATGSYGQRGRARIRIVQGIADEHRTELLAEVREFPCAVDSDHQLRRISVSYTHLTLPTIYSV